MITTSSSSIVIKPSMACGVNSAAEIVSDVAFNNAPITTPTPTSIVIGAISDSASSIAAFGPQPTTQMQKAPRGVNFLEVAPMTVSGTVFYVISNTAHHGA
jgi:hypothetical protein